MKKIALLLNSLLILSCSTKSWTKDEQSNFVKACKEEEGSSSYCNCYMENVMQEFPIAADANEIDFEIKIELSKDCE